MMPSRTYTIPKTVVMTLTGISRGMQQLNAGLRKLDRKSHGQWKVAQQASLFLKLEKNN